jgi:hypothetical protein
MTAFVWSRPLAWNWYGGDAGLKLPVKRGRLDGFSDIWNKPDEKRAGADVEAVR